MGKNMKKTIKLILLSVITLSFVLYSFPPSSFASEEVETYSPNIIMIEASTGKVVYEKDGYAPVPPASTTKVMTALLTLENCQLTDTAKVSHDAIYTVPVGYTHAYLVEGEILTIDQLLHILLIPSANDSANVLAEHIAGSTSSFATMMNTRAKELGCQNTNFVNANGIQAENHYSSAYDLAIIAREAMKNETFRKIVSTTSYTLPSTNLYPTADRYFKNTNQLILKDDRDSVDNYYYEYATGIKTGYTAAAGECIIASAKKDGIEYILVVLGAEKTENGLSARFIDCKNLFDYAFKNYKLYPITEENSVLKQVKISKAGLFDNNLDLIVQDKITLVLKNSTDTSTITPRVDITSDLTAPITKNSIIGTITYEVDGNTYTSNLLASRNIAEANFFNTILPFIFIILILFLLYRLTRTKKKKTKKKSKKRDNYMYW